MSRRPRPATVVAAAAVASAVLGFVLVWPELGRQRAEYASWSDYRIERAPAFHERLPRAPFDAYSAVVEPGLRYYVDVPGTARQGLVFRTYATYALLPAVPVASARRADVVFAYGTDVGRLGVPFGRVERPARGVTIAWPAR